VGHLSAATHYLSGVRYKSVLHSAQFPRESKVLQLLSVHAFILQSGDFAPAS